MKHKVDKVKLCIGYISKNGTFYTSLEKIGYILIFKKTYEYKNIDEKIVQKGNVDTVLTLQAIKDFYTGDLSHGILVSGDGDFDVVIDFWIEKDIGFDIIVPNHHKIPVLLKHYSAQYNPLIVIEDLRYKISE